MSVEMRYKPERALKLHRFAQQQVESRVTTQARDGIETSGLNTQAGATPVTTQAREGIEIVVQVPERPSLA